MLKFKIKGLKISFFEKGGYAMISLGGNYHSLECRMGGMPVVRLSIGLSV